MAYFVMINEQGPAWAPSRAMRDQEKWAEHAVFINGQVDAGVIIAAGPLGRGPEHRALLIVHSADEPTLRAAFAHDPGSRPGYCRSARSNPGRYWPATTDWTACSPRSPAGTIGTELSPRCSCGRWSHRPRPGTGRHKWVPLAPTAPGARPSSNGHVGRRARDLLVPGKEGTTGTPRWKEYYRWTTGRPPRELLLRILDHIDWEGRSRRRRRAIDLGFGSGTDTLELLRRGWIVLAIDGEKDAADFLARRVPPRLRPSLTSLVAPMEGVELPPADLIYASFSLPFCSPDRFPALWRGIRRALRPGGHFAGQLFGDRDEWHGQRSLTFHGPRAGPIAHPRVQGGAPPGDRRGRPVLRRSQALAFLRPHPRETARGRN